ncbi:MAG TPA: L-threonylcarbamoyladenylate synthase [Candidatus Dormibacteraeota bacterium]|jgi:L-threonylcarbamoyladenylate synthase|nr:L-threonylcarbamoyladenylate synthase [Candidatus Dormibacteraeota bacterium]
MTELDRLASILEGGGVIAIPTDTVYGLACHPDRPDAAERLFAIKRRPPEMELSLLAATPEDAACFGHLTAQARRLADAFWPGPLSIIVPATTPRHPAIPRQGDTISLRVPASPMLRGLLARTGPLATTSANLHGQAPAATAEEVHHLLGGQIDAVLDGGPASGQPSTIIDCSVTPARVLRTGPLGDAELQPYLEG